MKVTNKLPKPVTLFLNYSSLSLFQPPTHEDFVLLNSILKTIPSHKPSQDGVTE